MNYQRIAIIVGSVIIASLLFFNTFIIGWDEAMYFWNPVVWVENIKNQLFGFDPPAYDYYEA